MSQKILIIGSLNIDMVVDVDHIPVPGETILGENMIIVPGGKGANQACAAGRLGADTYIIGAVGIDKNAEMEIESLKSSNVKTEGIVQKSGENSGTAFITVNNEGNNSIVVIPGANKKLSSDDIDSKRKYIEECDIVIMQMEIPESTILYSAKLAKSLGKKVILDPAPVPKVFPLELYQYIDIIKPNSTEAAMLTGIEDVSANLKLTADKLHSYGVQDVVITLGEDGVYVDSESVGCRKIAAKKVQAIDTTAAGDTFTAAMAIKISEGKTLMEAAEFANAASAIVVTRKGAQSSIPTRKEVEDIMKK